jgi:hypothetical protein
MWSTTNAVPPWWRASASRTYDFVREPTGRLATPTGQEYYLRRFHVTGEGGFLAAVAAALAPGVVIAYERKTHTGARMVEAGIEIIPIERFELGRGRGGGHRMTCPLLRESGLARGIRGAVDPAAEDVEAPGLVGQDDGQEHGGDDRDDGERVT